MPSRHLTPDYAAAGLAWMLAQRHGRQVALLLPNAWDGTAGALLAAVDTAATHKGHSAVVNLFQHAKDRGIATANANIYLSGPPTYADKGMFVEQGHGSYLVYHDRGLHDLRLSHAHRAGAKYPMSPPPRWETEKFSVSFPDPCSWWRDVRGRTGPHSVRIHHQGIDYPIPLPIPAAMRKQVLDLLKLTLRAVPVQTTPVRGRIPNFALPASLETTTYSGLSLAGRAHFDYMFVYAALALVPARLSTATADAPARALPGHNVAAVLAGPTGKILSWGLNMGRMNATLHAEVGVIKAWQALRGGAADPPAESRLYTTLEPCFMCAGQICAYATVKGMVVVYVQPDTKFHPHRSYFDDVGFESVTADSLGLVYRGKGVGWTARLTATQARLATLAPDPATQVSYRSVITVLSQERSQARRFGKAALDLAGMGQVIADDRTLRHPETRMLISVWGQTMRLVMTVAGHATPSTALTADRVEAYLKAVGRYLDDTQHANALRETAALDAYPARKRTAKKYAKKAAEIATNIGAGLSSS